MTRHALRLAALFAFVVFTVAAAGNACAPEDSASVDQSRVYTGYWLYFDDNANQTSARAQFRLGHSLGTALELAAPASVSFNGQAMPFNPLLQWHEVQVTGLPDGGGGTFTYTNTDGGTFVNAASITRRIEFPADFPSQLERSAGFTLTWAGPPLAKGEDLELVVFNAAQPTNFIRVDQFDTGATSISVSSSDLAKVGGTQAGVSLRRHSFVDTIDAPNAGGRLQLTWEPKQRTVGLK